METSPIRAFLPVKLNEQERLEAGVKAAELQQKLDEMKSEAKQVSKQWKTEIDNVEAEFRANLGGVQNGIMSKETDATEVKCSETKLQWIEKNGQKFNIQEYHGETSELF